MRLIKAYLHRLEQDDKQTLGALSIYCGTDLIFSCKTLELPWRSNQPFISRIPMGYYKVTQRHSDTYGNHWHLQNVPGRDLILIHSGNFHRDTEGCICVGRDYYDIDLDGYRDVTSSKATMQALNNVLTVRNFHLWVM